MSSAWVKRRKTKFAKKAKTVYALTACLLFPLLVSLSWSDELKRAARPQALTEAEALYEKGLWVDAEKAFTKYAATAKNDKTKYESSFKAALCMIHRGETQKARNILSNLTTDTSAASVAPDAVANAHLEIYNILLKQKNATPNREQLVSKCAARFPDSPVSAKICEMEAGFWLKAGRPDKVRLYYGLAGKKISKTATTTLSLLSGGAGIPVSDEELRLFTEVSLANPEFSRPLGGLLSKRPDGWKVEYHRALLVADSGNVAEAIATLDGLIRTNCGPVDKIRLARVEMVAFRSSRPADAIQEYRDWLAANPRSEVREKAEYQLALLLSNCGLYAEALDRLGLFIKSYPAGRYTKMAEGTLVKVREAMKTAEQHKADLATKKKTQDADPLLPAIERGMKLMDEKKYALAAKEFQRFRGQEANPQWGRAWYGLGTCLRETGEPIKALAVWNEVWSRSLLFTNCLCGAESRKAAGDAYLEDCADADNALSCYVEVLKTKPELASNEKFDLNQAVCLLALGRSDEAKTIFLKRKGLVQGDKFWECYWNGMLSLCDGTRIQLLKTTGVIDRKARTRLVLGDSFFMADQSGKALKQYRIAASLASDPETLAYCNMQAGRCLAMNGNVRTALKAYDEMVSKYPKSGVADDALLRAGVLCAGPLGNLKEASRYFAKIVADYPESDNAEAAFIYLATTAWWSKQWDEAERLHKAFLEKYPKSAMNDLIRDRILPAIAGKTLETKEIEKENVSSNE